jgi:hypothetical protein
VETLGSDDGSESTSFDHDNDDDDGENYDLNDEGGNGNDHHHHDHGGDVTGGGDEGKGARIQQRQHTRTFQPFFTTAAGAAAEAAATVVPLPKGLSALLLRRETLLVLEEMKEEKEESGGGGGDGGGGGGDTQTVDKTMHGRAHIIAKRRLTAPFGTWVAALDAASSSSSPSSLPPMSLSPAVMAAVVGLGLALVCPETLPSPPPLTQVVLKKTRVGGRFMVWHVAESQTGCYFKRLFVF